jgi:hypothetical protein
MQGFIDVCLSMTVLFLISSPLTQSGAESDHRCTAASFHNFSPPHPRLIAQTTLGSFCPVATHIITNNDPNVH